jgi:hypothetical protein
MRILITGIGGPTPRSIAKTIRFDHPDYYIVGIDSNPKALGFFIPGLLDKYFLAPHVIKDSYWTFINDLIIKEKIDIAFVQPELEVIAWGDYFIKHKSFLCPVLIPPVELANILVDKSRMAEVLQNSRYIPKTIKICQSDNKLTEVENYIKFPCWIRASKGSGGLGALKIEDIANLKSWLYINREINEFTISEFLPGRHLANQMLYYNGKYIKGASVECVEYVMASVAPSKVTGNTSFGRFINEDKILTFCIECLDFICNKLQTNAHGVLSFDLKEDIHGNLKVTEVNIRHMAYTGIMAKVGFNLIEDTITILTDNFTPGGLKQTYFKFDKPYVFLRDVDTEPLILDNEDSFIDMTKCKTIL